MIVGVAVGCQGHKLHFQISYVPQMEQHLPFRFMLFCLGMYLGVCVCDLPYMRVSEQMLSCQGTQLSELKWVWVPLLFSVQRLPYSQDTAVSSILEREEGRKSGAGVKAQSEVSATSKVTQLTHLQQQERIGYWGEGRQGEKRKWKRKMGEKTILSVDSLCQFSRW